MFLQRKEIAVILLGQLATNRDRVALVESKLNLQRHVERIDLLRLLDGDLCQLLLFEPLVLDVQRRGAGPLRPVVEEPLERATGHMLEAAPKIRRLDRLMGVGGEIVLDGGPEHVVAHAAAEHVQDRCTLGIRPAIEHVTGILVPPIDHGPLLAALDPAPHRPQDIVVVLVLAQMVLGPHRVHERGEPLVEPEVRPVLARDVVSEPLVRKLMGDQTVGTEIQMRPLVVQRPGAEYGGRGVLHAAAEAVGTHLSIFVPGIFDARQLAEVVEHLDRVAEAALDVVPVFLGNVINNGLPSPRFGLDVKLTDNQRHQIRDMWLVLYPAEANLALRVPLLRHETSVRDHLVAFDRRHDHLGRLHLVGVVKTGDPIAVRNRLALRPDQIRNVRVGFTRREEVQTALGVVDHVVDRHGRPRVRLQRPAAEQNLYRLTVVDELDRVRSTLPTSELHARHLEIHGIEANGLEIAKRHQLDRGRAGGGLGRDIHLQVEFDVNDVGRSIPGDT